MKILITGVAGFIGYHVALFLIDHDHSVVGLDSLNDYYDVSLKYGRLGQLGIEKTKEETTPTVVKSNTYPNFSFIQMKLEEKEALNDLFQKQHFDVVCNLAAQAGVRYSLQNPEVYVDSNIVGFLNILECCRHYEIKHLVYASSSSVYGLNEKIPFKTSHKTDRPASLYAATKKSNELMAHTYSHLFKIPTTGLRFFTVYGPWGRPDMALFLFTEAILKGKPIDVYNFGEMARDFTYIDDICEGIVKVIEGSVEKRRSSDKFYKIYNIGNSKSVKLLDFIKAIELALGATTKKNMLPMQPGDVPTTWANVDEFAKDYNYRPDTSIKKGVQRFVDWYKDYYKV